MNLAYMSAHEIGDLVNQQKISAVEVIRYFDTRNPQVNKDVNALVRTRFDYAYERAEKIDKAIADGRYVGPFAGVPIGLKDFLPSKEGWSHSFGGVLPLMSIAESTGVFCKTLEDLGAIPIGMTNAPAFGFSGCCDNKLYGPTRNPFDYDYNSGGSSGGSAAGVAAGLITVGEGGDAGGSIRIPASWCNCFGFKPGLGTVPNVNRPDGWAATHPHCFAGPITRNVKDAITIMRSMARYDPRDPYSVRDADTMFWNSLYFNRTYHPSVEGKKIALTYNFGLYNTDPEIKEVIDKVAKILEEAGAEIIPVNVFEKPALTSLDNRFGDYTLDEYANMWCKMISIDTSIELQDWAIEGMDFYNNPDLSRWVPEEFLYWNRKAHDMTVREYYIFNQMRTAILDMFVNIFEKCDYILAPVTSCLPVKNTYPMTTGPAKEGSKSGMIQFAETFLVNFIGYPAASIPSGFSKSGLPIGAQLIGKFGSDSEMLEVCRVLEERNPWSYESAVCNRKVDV